MFRNLSRDRDEETPGDLVYAMAFRPAYTESVIHGCRLCRNKFIHQLGHLPRADSSARSRAIFYDAAA